MKRLLLFSALLALVAVQANAQGSNPRRVLIEEFTNTGCPPCAATDPAMEAFEASDISQICVLRYHTSWPDPTDPFYVDTKKVEGAAGIDPRIQSYYGANGVPYLRFSGFHGDFATDFPAGGQPDPTLYKAVADSVYALKSPYKMTITQTITADSIMADVTVTATDAVPASTDLRLAVVFAERYNPFHGSNGRPYYTSIVRKIVPGIASTGAISTSAVHPAFSQAMGTSQTYHYAAKLGTTWNLAQMMAVAFIQDPTTKEVYQANWTVPSVTVAGPDFVFDQVPSSTSSNSWTLTNQGTSNVSVKVTPNVSALPTGWSSTVTGADANNMVSLKPGESKDVSVSVSNSASKAIGFAKVNVFFESSDGIGLTGRQAGFLGADTKDLIVDATNNSAKYVTFANQLQTAGYAPAIIDESTFSNNTLFPDWSVYNHVIYNLGDMLGQFNTPGNLSLITAYVQGGGKFLLTGDWITGAYYAAYNSAGDETYLNDIRDAFEVEPKLAVKNSTWSKINGIVGDPISGGFSTTLAGRLAYRLPIGVAGPDAHAIFTNEKNDTIGVRAEMGAGKFVELSFGIDTIATADRATLLNRIVAYFDGTAAVKAGTTTTTSLETAYPNPSTSGVARINYNLTERGPVSLVVKDVLGKTVSTLVDQVQDANHYSVTFDGSALPNGTYYYTLTAGAQRLDGKVAINH